MLPLGDASYLGQHEDCSFRDCCPTLYWLLCWIPVALVAGLFSWAYYAYVVVFCYSIVLEENTVTAVALALVFHLLLFLCLWSFALTTLSAPIAVPFPYQLSAGEQRALSSCRRSDIAHHRLLDVLALQRGILTVGADGCVRICEPCCLVKPDRCHHCSTCRKCIPKMDHHCPWFNNCVHFGNYKFFLLTLFYAVALSVYGVATIGTHEAKAWLSASTTPSSLHLTLVSLLGAVLTFGLGSFLSAHISMLLSNETTLEDMRGPVFRNPEDSFDVGRYRNFVQVFGPRVSLWMAPVFTSIGDGVRFPTKLHPVLEVSQTRPVLADARITARDASPGVVRPARLTTDSLRGSSPTPTLPASM
ncbi:palmitoyltransferase ZDHHC15A-like isoform X1 [Dermacentor albipictus]|uniref:palmitoyltransferase ZDHHC15A-like isoform X1 n=1 Tax=Dermacentor albipictus TaxID=60249 RepID=UPI0038FC4115